MNDSQITVFDTLFSTDELRILKIIFPMVPERFQALLVLYIKFRELLFTVSFLKNHPNLQTQQSTDLSFFEQMSAIADEIYPYCSSKDKELLRSMRSLFSNFQKFKELAPLLSMFGEESADSKQSFDFDGLLNGFLGKDNISKKDYYESLFD